jgi:hypothetical protein
VVVVNDDDNDDNSVVDSDNNFYGLPNVPLLFETFNKMMMN